MKRALQRLDTVHEKLLSAISDLGPDVYAEPPAEGEWSVGEIVHHLCLVEERVIKELERAIDREPQRPGLLKRLVPTAIISLRLVRVKAPNAVNPLNAPRKEVALENFDRVRSRLKALCAAHGNQRFRQIVFKHPFLGDIDGVATISFVAYHEQRHYKQLREVLRKLSEPGAVATG